MAPIMINVSIPHMNYMYHQLKMSEDIMKEDMGKNILIVTNIN